MPLFLCAFVPLCLSSCLCAFPPCVIPGPDQESRDSNMSYLRKQESSMPLFLCAFVPLCLCAFPQCLCAFPPCVIPGTTRNPGKPAQTVYPGSSRTRSDTRNPVCLSSFVPLCLCAFVPSPLVSFLAQTRNPGKPAQTVYLGSSRTRSDTRNPVCLSSFVPLCLCAFPPCVLPGTTRNPGIRIGHTCGSRNPVCLSSFVPLCLCAFVPLFVPLCLPPLCPSCPRPEIQGNRTGIQYASLPLCLCAFVPSPLVSFLARPGIQGFALVIPAEAGIPYASLPLCLCAFVPLCLSSCLCAFPPCVLPGPDQESRGSHPERTGSPPTRG